MPPYEPRALFDRRFLLVSAFAVALWLFLVNPSTALAGGDHQSQGWGSSDHGSSDWQHGTEGSPPSWDHTPDQGHPPSEGSTPGQPCENQGPPELVAGLGAGLELGRAETLSFVSVVIALYLVPGAI